MPSDADTSSFRSSFAKEPPVIGNVKDAEVKFTKVEDYLTFFVEYAFLDGNIVLHFFPPKEQYAPAGADRFRVNADFLLKWQRQFPQVLSPTAEAYFQATYPVIQAQYIPEMASWWMRAGGFAHRLDAEGFILGFFAKLDQALDAADAAAASSRVF